MHYFVYILYSARIDRYYIGQTNDLEGRFLRHNRGYERYTSTGVPWELIWKTTKPSRVEAIRLERKLKNLSRRRLIVFIEKYLGEVEGPDDADMQSNVGMSGC